MRLPKDEEEASGGPPGFRPATAATAALAFAAASVSSLSSPPPPYWHLAWTWESQEVTEKVGLLFLGSPSVVVGLLSQLDL